MTDSLQTDSPPPIPRTMVLGYFGSTAGPTRVRRITAIGLLILAVLDTGLAGTLALIFGRPVLDEVRNQLLYPHAFGPSLGRYSPMPKPVASPTLADWVRAVYEGCGEFMVPLLMLLFAVLCSFMLSLAISGVYRGRRRACRVALGPAALHVVLFILGSAGMLTFAAVLLADNNRPSVWVPVLLATLGIFSGLLALLMIDLCAFLRWIARTPDANPPPRKFL